MKLIFELKGVVYKSPIELTKVDSIFDVMLLNTQPLR